MGTLTTTGDTVRRMPRQSRPKRAELAALIRETGGSMTALGERLGISRTTAYNWVYQLGLADQVGIDYRSREQREADKKADEATMRSVAEERRKEARERRQTERQARPFVHVGLPPELWKQVRVAAIEGDRSTSSIVEEALGAWLAARRQ